MFLLDTTLLSETVAVRPDRGVQRWLLSQPEPLLFTTVVVVGELRQGQVRVRDDVRSRLLNEWLTTLVIPRFGRRILPVTLEIAERWGRLEGEAYRAGAPLPRIYAIIAATAIVHDLVIVTRDTRDFERCGARTLSPWEGF